MNTPRFFLALLLPLTVLALLPVRAIEDDSKNITPKYPTAAEIAAMMGRHIQQDYDKQLGQVKTAPQDGKPVIPKFPTAKSATALSRQVRDYDTHLRLAQAASHKGMDLTFAKHDVEQDMKSAAEAGQIAKAKTLMGKYKALGVQEGSQNGTMTKQMTEVLGLYRAIVASPLYAGHFTQTTVALSPMEGSEYLTDMGAGQLKFIKPK